MIKIDKNKLVNIVNDYWNDYQKNIQDLTINSFIVKPSIPVVWFGNIYSYFNSHIRTLTIAINPSSTEFLTNGQPDVSLRFTKATDINEKYHPDSLIDSLNEYFCFNPYSRWFNLFDQKCMGFIRQATKGFDVGYNLKTDTTCHENVALHVDLDTALATDPTWGKIPKNVKSKLSNQILFTKLFNFLDPNVVLVSIRRQRFLEFGKIMGYDFSTPKFKSSEKNMDCYLDRGKLFFFGRSMGQPFAPIRDEEKSTFMEQVFNSVTFDKENLIWK